MQQSNSENTKRIIKNTMFLYIRMFVIMIVGLYASRIILQALGAVDFGIYNVVGGVIVMASFLTNTMASASQRFFAYEIGQNNYERLRETFSASFNIYALFSFFILLLGETVGLWFMSSQLNIPEERHFAALVVYHLSIFSFILSLIRIPYNSMIIAYEHMDFYAWISIVEAFLKVLIIYFLSISEIDKLCLYAFLVFVVTGVVSLCFYLFCKIKFNVTKIIKVKEKDLYRSLLGFSGWNLFGSFSNMLMDQGVNILLNIYFGPVINAARGLAFQVKSQVMSFVAGFQTAANPQIIKYYAADDKESMKKLMFQCSRYTFYLLFGISLPVLLEMDILLRWWLSNVPDYTVLFARLAILIILVDSLSGNIIPAIQATGNIKWYQIGVGITKLFNLPITYIFFILGYGPHWAMIISIFLNFLCLFVRLDCLERQNGIPKICYIHNVVKYDLIVSITSIILPLFAYFILDKGITSFIVVCIVSSFSTFFSILYIGISKQERLSLFNVIKKKIQFV